MKYIDHLILVAGASCIGKTTLIKGLKRGKYSRLCKQLGIDHPDKWIITSLKAAHKTTPYSGKLLIQYDCYNRRAQSLIHELINRSNCTTVLTLCAPPRTLIWRNTKRLASNIYKLMLDPGRFDSMKRKISCDVKGIIRNDHQSDKVIAHYKVWFEFLSKYQVESYWLGITSSDIPTNGIITESMDAPINFIQNA